MSAPFVVSQAATTVWTPDASAPAVTAGALGIEARHTWYGELGPIVLNYLWDDSGNRLALARPGASPASGRVASAAYIKLSRIQGLHSRPDADDNRAQIAGRPGEVIYPSQLRGKTVTYEGTIHGASLADLRRVEAQLRRATAGTYSGFMVIEPHPTYASTPWAYFARCTQLEVVDEQTASPTAAPGPHQRSFVAAFRLHDARLYVWQQRQSMGNANGGGGSVVTNQGSAPSDPTITLHPVGGGTVNAPVLIHNDTNGVQLRLDAAIGGTGISSNLLTGVNGHVDIDFYNRTIKNETGFSLLRCLDVQASNWWDEGIMGLIPGNNTIRVETPSTGTFDVAWLDASW